MKENLYIKKFKNKTRTELEFKVNNSEVFEPDAVYAAKYILENFDKFEKYREKKTEFKKEEIKEFVFKEKAIFKNKWIYRIALVSTLITAISFFWIFTVRDNFDFLIWSIINFLFFIVLIVRDKKTLPKLKLLSIISLFFIIYRYVIYYVSLEEKALFNFEIKDVKFIAIYLFIILGGDLLIEIKKVKVSK
ncbi:hypothetical protein R3X25_15000 [Lutibacter sp. TH_r2]|uniref:hypothetical protein n=1 Tax=Lutibacter sp. TH_r2 TaxID=3082083 RepID=UPI002954C890|nr:hypothetical protein [Lutibacter sp. TH_r2]MDV7188593.1 hypothetical protein [Lutibacter sp. TH_r2]